MRLDRMKKNYNDLPSDRCLRPLDLCRGRSRGRPLRQMMLDQTGASCPTGITLGKDPLTAQVQQDWLNEFERVQRILRLSPRLRKLHKD
jgi:hypothetical protein